MTFKVDPQTTLTYGNPQAPHELTLILNLGCVDTRDWWSPNQAALFTAIDEGQLQVHLKFWNKVKPTLLNGNVANGYVDYRHPAAALSLIKAVFQNQDPLRDADLAAVPAYLEKTYQVAPYAQADTVRQQIDREVAANGITSLPTVIYQGQAYADETLPTIADLLTE
ncbi:thioredoxin domain-containing protein [Lactiplantibacillus songbeiensis]|uniref:Thioredoxin domain-containing protein n=1 Tax=Lactiplantibacillus songbeiensis TaxID=2559920 RepID=A0ABW4BWS9_9LACO|nr:thioredoxin domain-containing protein [Lactiplantibacillus songbeiensis]